MTQFAPTLGYGYWKGRQIERGCAFEYGAYLIEVRQRRVVALKVVGDGLEVEFDRMYPPHDLIDQLRQHKIEVRRLRGEPSQEPYHRDPRRPALSVTGPD